MSDENRAAPRPKTPPEVVIGMLDRALVAEVANTERLEGALKGMRRLLSGRDERLAELEAALAACRGEAERAVADLRYWAEPGQPVAEVRRAMLRAAERLEAALRAPGEDR